jgi:hypothetical protein
MCVRDESTKWENCPKAESEVKMMAKIIIPDAELGSYIFTFEVLEQVANNCCIHTSHINRLQNMLRQLELQEEGEVNVVGLNRLCYKDVPANTDKSVGKIADTA